MSVSTQEPRIIRTERGLTIAGTRVTLYQLMDYIHANYPRPLIRHQFHITAPQFDAAMAYIDAHHEQVEREYQIVLQQAKEIRQYYSTGEIMSLQSLNYPPNLNTKLLGKNCKHVKPSEKK